MVANAESAVVKPNNPKVKSATPSLSHVGLKRSWILIDLEGLVLGRVASFVAHRLRGKHRPDYTAHVNCGDSVVLINADKVVLTGNKETDKVYYHHTGYPGGIKSVTVRALREKKSEDLVNKAVARMLGRGPLPYKMLKNLYVYAGPDHLHAAQQPEVLDFGSFNRKNKNK